jgi:acetolactate synthase-1/2/3 large subunit
VHVDQTPAEVDASYVPVIEVLGDIGSSLDRMTEMGRHREGTQSVSILREFIIREIEHFQDDTSFPMKPQKIIADLRKSLGKKDIVISDVGAHKLWIARMFPCYYPNTCLISNGFASMGIALPGAVSAKMVHPDRNIVAVTGDGGFLMNVQELETAVRMGNPFVVLVLNDQSYGLIRWKQLTNYGRATAVDWGPIDFKMLAESFGARGYRVEAAQELQPILQDSLAANQVAVIDCPVDFNENIRLTEHLGHIVCPI